MVANIRKVPISGALLSSWYSKSTMTIAKMKTSVKDVTGEEITDKNLEDLFKQLGLDLETRDKPKYVFGKLLESNVNGTRYIIIGGGGYTVGSPEYDTHVKTMLAKEKAEPIITSNSTNLANIVKIKDHRNIDSLIKAYLAAGFTVIDQERYYGTTTKVEYKDIEEEAFNIDTVEEQPFSPNGHRYTSLTNKLVMEVWGGKGYVLGSKAQKEAKSKV